MQRIKEKSRLIANSMLKQESGEYQSYGAAMGLMKLRRQRQELQAELPPLKIVATGVSCRDCRFYAYDDGERICEAGWPIKVDLCADMRAESGQCGPTAELFWKKETDEFTNSRR